MTSFCQHMFGDVGLVSGHVRRGRLIVVTCSAKSCFCRDMFAEVGIVSGRFRRGMVSVDTFSARFN